MNRLVVTGMGAITPVGIGVPSYWQGLLSGKCGISSIKGVDVSNLPVRIAGQILDFNPLEFLPRQIVKNASSFIHYAYAAGIEAIRQANLKDFDKTRAGICMGTAMGGVQDLAKSGLEYEENSKGRISPHLVPRSIGNMACAYISINYGFRGPGMTLNTACSAGSDAIQAACMLLLAGDADIMLVMGGESIISPPIISSLAQAKALSRRNDEPEKACRPFDLNRDGFVIGEGGGAIILETEESALARNAQILAEVKGWANTLDGYHVTAPDPEGNGVARCMKIALKRAGIHTGDVNYINVHGTSTQLGDKAETMALKKVFGANVPLASSTKSATGHLMGAGGLTEVIACIQAINKNAIPPTLNLDTPDPECDLDYVANIARNVTVNIAMSNSMGFGGQNSSIVLSKYE